MRKLFLAIGVILALLVATSIIFINISYAGEGCPSCGMSMIWTGETKTEWGKLLNLYRCPANHYYWIVSGRAERGSSFGPTCPVCGMSASWTGETRIEWGKLQKIYKCPAGHLSVGQ